MSYHPGKGRSVTAYVLSGISLLTFIYSVMVFNASYGLLHSGKLSAIFIILLIPLLWLCCAATLVLCTLSAIFLGTSFKVIASKARKVVNIVIFVINIVMAIASCLFAFLLL